MKIEVKPTDYRFGDGQLKLTGVTTTNWLNHFDFFVRQKVSDGDTSDCWCFGGTKNLDAFMDALIAEGLLPQSVVDEITSMGFMDTGIDNQLHFHSSERFAGVLSGLGTNGGNLNTAAQIFRQYGCVPFKLLPVTPDMTLAEYFAPIQQNIKDIGAKFLALMGGKDFCQYQWVNDGGATNIPKMAQAIAKAPFVMGVPVNAGWNQVHPTIATGAPAHVVSGYAVNPDSSVSISDNYAPFLKVLDKGYQISYVAQMIIQYIAPQPIPVIPIAPMPSNIAPTQQNLTILQEIAATLKELLSLLGEKLSGILKGLRK